MSGDDPLGRRVLGEFLGTGLLVAAVVGSGIAARKLSPGDVGLELFENAAATTGALVAIILAVGPVSGAHLNPVVTLADRLFGGIKTRAAAGYILAQLAGGWCGAVVANLMFSRAALELSTKTRSGGGLWLAEVVATFGLLLVVFGVVRSGRAGAAPFAVGAYIGGAYFFTASTSFANPAVTFSRMFSDTFAGIRPSSVPAFMVAQLVGTGLAVAAIRVLYPNMAQAAQDVVVPHPATEAAAGGDGKGRGGIDVPEVLFVCVHNAGRSQMAAALLDHYARGQVRVRSAGSAPGDRINPAVVAVMDEIGIDLSKEFPKPLTDDAAKAADVIVTMGCGDTCPVYLGKRYLDWELPDPAGKSVEDVRPIRDEIDRRVRRLLQELVPVG
ncbi:MAG TPA: aquaporin [Acidimicrobiales bacterium]|nr:aquaporin [Acidimicrobiales bacterium]